MGYSGRQRNGSLEIQQINTMSNLDKQFSQILSEVLLFGEKKEDRTGVGTISYAGAMIRHDMAEGFPLLTLRKIPFKPAAVELEGFINGITSKKWYKERGCNWWNQWCSPEKVAYASDPATIAKMAEEDYLGPIYGAQMRNFEDPSEPRFLGGVDQLKFIVDELKTNQNSRRMVVSYWNPLANDSMALVPCHYSWQVNVLNGKLNLFYIMRSVDFILGNALQTYGLLLHLLAKESGLKEGMLIGHYNDVHVYLNQILGAKQILNRNKDINCPKIKTDNFSSIFDWKHSDTSILNYNPQEAIKFDVAI